MVISLHSSRTVYRYICPVYELTFAVLSQRITLHLTAMRERKNAFPFFLSLMEKALPQTLLLKKEIWQVQRCEPGKREALKIHSEHLHNPTVKDFPSMNININLEAFGSHFADSFLDKSQS